MKHSIVQIGSSLHSILEAINAEPVGIAFMVDRDCRLIGVLTDGDVRRMLLNGSTIDTTISQKDLSGFVYAKQGIPHEDLLKLTSKKVRVIPLVNDNMEVVDFFRYEHKTNFIPVAEPDLKGNELKYLTDAFLSTWISSRGEYIDRFENSFSRYCDAHFGVAVANGTVALHLALETLGIKEGDEVILPDLTFAATINAVLHTKATPVIVDVEAQAWTIDPLKIQQAITEKTKAIIAVHVYGQPCEMDDIMEIAKQYDLFVIEDCAEAHGAEYDGRKVGSFGHINTFSFFANKVITTGEGGMCTTNDPKLNERMRVLRDHGMSTKKKYWHDYVGYNYRMTNLQAAIGCAQLERIDSILKKRSEIENYYKSIFSDEISDWQKDFPKRKRIIWLVSALAKDRESLQNKLRYLNIDCRPFFYPLSSMSIYKKYVPFKCEFSTAVSQRGINLPTYSALLENNEGHFKK